MTMSGRVTRCCVALLLTLTSVSSVQRLNSINELIQNDPSLCEQISALLQWFANTADIYDNGIRLTFDPERGDYGSHYYSNFEKLLEQPCHGQRDYTLGNIYQESPLKLPQNVVNNRRNRVRIIVRIRDVNPGRQAQRIDRVYITQHYDVTSYDPGHTYEISTNFLRQMRNDQWTNASPTEQYARHTPHLQSYNYRDHHQENQWSAVDALMIVFVAILFLCFIIYALVHSQQPKSRWQ